MHIDHIACIGTLIWCSTMKNLDMTKFDKWFDDLPIEKQNKLMFSAAVFATSMLLIVIISIITFIIWFMTNA